MQKKSAKDDTAKMTAAALQLVAEKGWEALTLEGVAKTAKIAPEIVRKKFTAREDLIAAIAEEFDREAIAKAKPSGTAHDDLFDLLMARFDVLQQRRKAILAMSVAARYDRALAKALTRAALASAGRMIDFVKIATPPRPILVAGLIAVYAWTFTAWRKDESRDMAKTMAALDRALRLAGRAVEIIKPRS